MKFFHLSDLHIGLKLINRDLREDQEYIFHQIAELAMRERPEAPGIAGHIYDKAVPSAEAMEVLDGRIEELTQNLPELVIMMISGNHDSAVRGNCYRSVLARQRLHMSGLPPVQPEENIEKVVLRDAYGSVNFYLLPFVKPSMVKQVVGTDENGNNDVSMSSIEASVDGVKLELERQYSNYNNTDSKSKDYVARFSLKASSAKQNFEITIGNFNTKGDQLYIKDKYNFSFTADPKILERDTKEVFIDQFIQLDEKQTVTISKAKYNLFSCTLYGTLPDMNENTELWIRGKDDVGNEISFNLISYRNPELIFELAEPGSARNAKKLTLQLYQYTENEESNILYKKEDYGDFYAEEIGKEYNENQSPEELAVPVGNEFTVDLQN